MLVGPLPGDWVGGDPTLGPGRGGHNELALEGPLLGLVQVEDLLLLCLLQLPVGLLQLGDGLPQLVHLVLGVLDDGEDAGDGLPVDLGLLPHHLQLLGDPGGDTGVVLLQLVLLEELLEVLDGLEGNAGGGLVDHGADQGLDLVRGLVHQLGGQVHPLGGDGGEATEEGVEGREVLHSCRHDGVSSYFILGYMDS